MVVWPVLTILICIPVVGVLLIMANHQDDEQARKNSAHIALFCSGSAAALSVCLAFLFDPRANDLQFAEATPLIDGVMRYHLGMDSLARPFVLLVALVIPCLIIVSLSGEGLRSRLVLLLLAEASFLGLFLAQDSALWITFLGSVVICVLLMQRGADADRGAIAVSVVLVAAWLLLTASILEGQLLMEPVLQDDQPSEPAFSSPVQNLFALLAFIGLFLFLALGPVYCWVFAKPEALDASTAAVSSAILPLVGSFGLLKLGFFAGHGGGSAFGAAGAGIAGLSLAVAGWALTKRVHAAPVFLVLSLVSLAAPFAAIGLGERAATSILTLSVGSAITLSTLWIAKDVVVYQDDTAQNDYQPGFSWEQLVTAGLLIASIAFASFVPGSAGFGALVELGRMTGDQMALYWPLFGVGFALMGVAALRQLSLWRIAIEKLAEQGLSSRARRNAAPLGFLVVIMLGFGLLSGALAQAKLAIEPLSGAL